MNSIKVWVEDHPYLTGTLIVGMVLLFIIIRNRSKSGGASSQTVYQGGTSDALQAAQLQAGTQIQSAQLAAQTQIAGYNAASNAQALQSAASIAQAHISAGVTDYQTAAQLQIGLATLGYTPSTSPFGLTLPISGSIHTSPTAPIVQPNPPLQNAIPDINIHILPTGPAIPFPPAVINPGVPTAPNVPVDHTIVSSYPQVPSSVVSREFTGITLDSTHAGTGGLVSVPSVPIYGPLDTYLGNTAPSSIPSSSGLNWQQYYAPLVESRYNPSSVQPMDVASLTAANVAAQLDYINNPMSCHNRVCA